MSTLNLHQLLSPKSITLIGASDHPGSVGTVVMNNLLRGGFKGPIHPVNPKYESVAGRRAYADVAALPEVPELAVICTPAATVPALISALGERGTRAAVVLSAGFHETGGASPTRRELLLAAQPHGLRLLGPNCIGHLNPHIGLNASFSHVDAMTGHMAFIAQSGALCTAVIDWARANDVGFSHVVSLGDMVDVDFGDLLDFLGSDGTTHGALLYVESVTAPRKFLSAARAIARDKPVIAIKAGRSAAGARAALSHTGAMTGSYEVFESALRRAGIVLVDSIETLFDAAEALALCKHLPDGDRLAIVTNGGGPGVLAADALITQGGTLAPLSPATIQKLDAVLPAAWSRANPVDIVGDADAQRYQSALDIVIGDPDVDAVMAVNVPTALVSSADAGQAVKEVAVRSPIPVFACWMGESTAAAARSAFEQAGIPAYATPHAALHAFLTWCEYRRTQENLSQTPVWPPEDWSPDIAAVSRIIRDALTSGREVLTEIEAKQMLTAYRFPVVETHHAADVESAVALAERMGYPVALKILSRDISHKSDVGGVALDLDSAPAVKLAAEGMLARVRASKPAARVDGFSIQRMVSRVTARELILGMTVDNVFGPVMLFGDGGTAVEVLADTAIALPPLNMHLAHDLMQRTRVYRLLRGYRHRAAANLEAIALSLVRLSQMIIDRPEIVEIDINPLLADEKGVVALDARIRVRPAQGSGVQRLAIRPYPRELEETLTLDDGEKFLIRPIRPEDEPAHRRLFEKLRPEDIYYRFFNHIREMSHAQLARYTQIDYDREMAFIATRTIDGEGETLGVVRAITHADNTEAEFAVIIRPDYQKKGLGRALMEKIIRYVRERGTGVMTGQILSINYGMIALAKHCGFTVEPSPEGGVAIATLSLR
ncbi:MAG TPA: bifunctional acetate--CoA ligase family protein/GNAT family N-acetyltransferase [Gammaproteobacteria bacterium]|nr:bifunctional acetate--CoA ligase family protein/GNAT family N-acetyltransferase [Gammaproteobacteria bacterium]